MEKENNDLVNDNSFQEAPEVNPDAGQPAVVRRGPESPDAKTHIAGKDLLPSESQAAGSVPRYLYWLGLTPSCPVESLDVGGVNFPKLNERLVQDQLRTGRKRRVPVIGAITWLDERKIRILRERLPRTIIRFLDQKAIKDEPNTGLNVGDVHVRPRRGHVITIPTPKDLENARKRGKPTRPYVPRPGDVPAARFMFAQLCGDQKRGERGDVYPDPLEITGLAWPDEIAEETKSLLE